MALLRKLWEASDFWDKEENRKQREQQAAQAQQQTNPNNAPRRNIASRAFDQVNPFDNGRTFKQNNTANTLSTIQQITHNGITNTAGNFVKPFAQTVNAAAVEPARATLAAATGNKTAYNAADRRRQIALDTSLPAITARTAVDVGSMPIHLTKEAIGSATGNNIAEQNARNKYFQALNRTPFGQVTSIAQNKAAEYQVRRDLPNVSKDAQAKLIAQNKQSVGLDPGASFGKQLLDTITGGAALYAGIKAPLSFTKSVVEGISGAPRVSIPTSIPRPTPRLTPLNEAGSVRLPFTQGNPGDIPIRVNNPLGAKTGLEINNPLGARTKPLQVRNVSGGPLDTPIKVVNNSGAPLVGEGLSGAAQQSWLSKIKNSRILNDEVGAIGPDVGKLRDEMDARLQKANESLTPFDKGRIAKSEKDLKRSNEQLMNPGLPRRSQSPLRAGMTEDEFFQRFNPAVRDADHALSRSSASLDAPRTSPLERVQPERPQIPTIRPQSPQDIPVPSTKSTPKQLSIKESTTPFTAEQQKIVDDYASMLKDVGEGNGVALTGSGARVSNNFRTSETKGKQMSKQAWRDEALRQIESGKAPEEITRAYKELSDPEFRSLVQSEEAMTAPGSVGDKFTTDPLEGFRQKIQQRSSEKNIPVRKLTQDGDVVTATNVNPNIKAGEKRYSVDHATGDLIEDKQGATSLFTDDEGRVTGFRIGNETFSAKELGDLSDTNGYGSSMATMRRNIERSFGKQTGEKVNSFLVDHQQQQATRMIERKLALKDGLQQQADNLGISFSKNSKRAKEVSAAIQDYGEGAIKKPQLIEKFGKEYADKIVAADTWFRTQYNSLLDEMNSTLTQYGYDPVPKRKNYYTHFQEPGLWQKFGLRMQEIKNLSGPTLQDATPDASRGLISNKLAGQSEFTTPNKRFNPFALRREGEIHTADAFKSFEKYIEPTLNNIYMTPSIARARVLTRAIAQDADIVGKDANHIIVQTKEWANRLAGKSNRFDRPLADTKGGQMYLKATNWVQRKAGANTIVGNLSTAVMQPILLAQTVGKSGLKNTILGAMQEMSSAHAQNAPIRQSAFMRRRYADLTDVTAGKSAKIAETLNKPLEVVEETAARISWNAAHNDALSKGLTGKKAIQYADVQTEKTLAGRAIGERPELYESKAASPVTMYQLEVNNFWQQFGKEMTKGQAAKTMAAAYGLNLLLQQATGKQVGFNPIDAAIDSYQETKKEEKGALDKAKTIGQRWAGELVDNTPLVGPIANMTIGDKNLRALLGPSTNTGRFGVSSPLSAAWSTTKIGNIPVPQNLVLPYGGGQAKKTYEGAKALIGGRLTDKNGDTTVNVSRTPANIARGLAFGPSAIPEVGAYYDNTGKKKVDQRTVPNQYGSVAGTQGLNGLTKDQQEMLRDTLPQNRDALIKQFNETNKTDRKVEKETETFKKSGASQTLSNGKVMRMVDGKPKTFDSKQEADKYDFEESFKKSSKKTDTFGDTVYQKRKDGTVFKKNKFEYEYDKGAYNRKLQMDRATANNDLKGYVDLAQKEYDSLEKLKGQYDPETEQDKIDALTLKQENLLDKVDGYLEKGYIKKGKGGKGKKINMDLLSQAKVIDAPKIRKSSLSVKKPSIPKMGGVKTPRVASRPRNRGNVTSTKTRIS